MPTGIAPRSLALLLASVCLGVPAAHGAGELTLQGAFASGSYGTDTDTDARALLLRYVTGNELPGNRFQLRIEVPFLDLDAASPVTPGPIGPIPRKRHGSSGSAGSMGQTGNGNGPGDAGPVDGNDPPQEPVPGVERIRGLGDVALGVSARLLGGGAKIYLLNADLGVKLPTGNEEKNLGTGETDFRVGASGEYRSWSVTGFGGAGWTRYGDPESGPLDDGFDAWAGAESLPLADRVIVSGWVSGGQEVVKGAGAHATANLGFRTVGKWRWRGSLSAGLTDAAADFRVQVGVSFGVDVPTAGRRGSWR